MLQITEDTPPDMLAGAMDLTVHLPNGKSTKMSVERSTPMMDLLVQITTNNHLQLSGYTLQALSMAPSGDNADRILPFKPNTFIGALDTQHIKVVPKAKPMQVPKNIPPGHQPFESTFRLKVHLPRNQLYVTRVSQSVHLQDIMRKVCEEKNLDPIKYEFRHPGNLDESLDPKLSLSDYKITEIYLVSKGTGNLNQAFSTSDIMALRKEEERKQMHNKTGGGVFNLIFRRTKPSTGSVSSDNRSISPTQSDDSRSVTPPALPQAIITPPQPEERPKPPQRKRRPAPKPPQELVKSESPTSEATKNGLTICHSRNSSDSSGYHEASILSDNLNTSLPRRPKSTILNEEQGTSNLSKMSLHSKSTSSLAFPNRKKKTAPPPPPAASLQEPSPVVASQPSIVAQEPDTQGKGKVLATNPVPAPRVRAKANPAPRPRSIATYIQVENELDYTESDSVDRIQEQRSDAVNLDVKVDTLEKPEGSNVEAVNPLKIINEEVTITKTEPVESTEENEQSVSKLNIEEHTVQKLSTEIHPEEHEKIEAVNLPLPESENDQNVNSINQKTLNKSEKNEMDLKDSALLQLQKQTVEHIFKSEHFASPVNENAPVTEDQSKTVKEQSLETAKDVEVLIEPKPNQPDSLEESLKVKPPEIVAVYPKSKDTSPNKSFFDSFTRKRGFQIGSSLLDQSSDDDNTSQASIRTAESVASALNAFQFVDEIEDVDVEMFNGKRVIPTKATPLNQLHGMHEFEKLKKDNSTSSLRSNASVPGFLGISSMKKWNDVEGLDNISLNSNGDRSAWVIGDTSDTDSNITSLTRMDSLRSFPSIESKEGPPQDSIKENGTVNSEEITVKVEEPAAKVEEPKLEIEVDPEPEWTYQLPSPPKAFRDSSPEPCEKVATFPTDSVVTSPDLFEKFKEVSVNGSERQSEARSEVSEEDKPILNTLTLENLEKRKSLVYNRELATSLKLAEEEKETLTSTISKFEKTYEELRRSSLKEAPPAKSTLPNFKITTYDNPKQKINIFEDDTIRSSEKVPRRSSSNLVKNYMGRSMESISFNDFKKPYKPQTPAKTLAVSRSESFSDQGWSPTKPVMRSKSQLTINKYKDNKIVTPVNEDNLIKSNSLYDVSGLQSLEVMRLIQNKLNTPTGSVEQLDSKSTKQEKPEVQKPEKKIYQYRTPSINMGTWSDRPKVPVNVKDDPDYKHSSNNTKLIVNTTHNNMRSYNSIEVINKSESSFNTEVKTNSEKNVSVQVNNSEPICTQNTGNVVIKIGGYRRPLGNVNKNERPHSVAFGNDFDISRVPIVRSVELKKPYKEINTSVTQIYQNEAPVLRPQFGPKPFQKTNTLNRISYAGESEPKSVFRANSFVQNTNPVVRGFRINTERTWQPQKDFGSNKEVPFSQNTLKRTETRKNELNQPPPAPKMKNFNVGVAKVKDNADPRDELLQAIRSFGGKKGLRAVKA